MIDGLFSGLLGSLFGPAIAHWLSRYKYWAIFFVATLLTQVLSIAFMLKELGLKKTVKTFFNGINPVFFFRSNGHRSTGGVCCVHRVTQCSQRR